MVFKILVMSLLSFVSAVSLASSALPDCNTAELSLWTQDQNTRWVNDKQEFYWDAPRALETTLSKDGGLPLRIFVKIAEKMVPSSPSVLVGLADQAQEKRRSYKLKKRPNEEQKDLFELVGFDAARTFEKIDVENALAFVFLDKEQKVLCKIEVRYATDANHNH